MTTQLDTTPSSTTRIFACTQCPKIFATRSNLKRHMENPNIHNIPYIRSRDQKRWKGHAKKVVSKEETTERMRKWRAENREKNRQNDLRCRVYRLARQKFGEHDSPEKQQFVCDEITRRLGHEAMVTRSTSVRTKDDLVELPFYSGAQRKIELPSIDVRRSSFHSSASSSPALPHLSPSWRNERRTSSSSVSTLSSFTSDHLSAFTKQPTSPLTEDDNDASERNPDVEPVRYVEQTRILDEFVGVVLNYAGHRQCREHSS
ncbi:hypothetical protein BDB00DRAFT_948749 [Zychaea mexicana]|uniref:uncharacterized protein n=1 Tax=Zychaea mexicana TaxID=64656 RepID=UPI0022FE7FD3|nr:uncharacterized protein BDB00DRAFT_948749 [Zychaea mexicana]KAI9499701.1 hypothetical protein BDB00DRAFT_948749 [Zychaea mexicana]